MNTNCFDLPEFQQEVREAKSAKALFALWDTVCQMYDRRRITKYELEEMRDIIWPRMKTLASLEDMIECSFSAHQMQHQEKLAS